MFSAALVCLVCLFIVCMLLVCVVVNKLGVVIGFDLTVSGSVSLVNFELIIILTAVQQ